MQLKRTLRGARRNFFRVGHATYSLPTRSNKIKLQTCFYVAILSQCGYNYLVRLIVKIQSMFCQNCYLAAVATVQHFRLWFVKNITAENISQSKNIECKKS